MKTTILADYKAKTYVGGASAAWNYNADEDAWIQAPNSGIAGIWRLLPGVAGCVNDLVDIAHEL